MREEGKVGEPGIAVVSICTYRINRSSTVDRALIFLVLIKDNRLVRISNEKGGFYFYFRKHYR